MQSEEYPDLPFVEAKAYLNGRPYGRPLWIVIHTTEGSEGLISAESGADYDTRRTDGTSTHYFHDQDSTVQTVYTWDRANAAKGTGNKFGLHHELCGVAAQTPAQWDDAASRGTIAQCAKQAARDARRWDIPVRRLTVAQVAAMQPGFCAHADISAAFHESDHTDPGKNYPWPSLLAQVNDHLGVTMPLTDAEYDEIEKRAANASRAFWWDAAHAAFRGPDGIEGDATYRAADAATQKRMRNARDTIQDTIQPAILEELKGLSAEVAAMPGILAEEAVTEIVTGVLAGLPQAGTLTPADVETAVRNVIGQTKLTAI